MKAVQFKNVWENYRIKFVVDNHILWEDFWALKDVSFDIEQGETVAIIGENGSGKSTILKLIAGMLNSDRGEVRVAGKACGLLELGAGFHPELTGKENVYLQGSLFGLSKLEVDSRFEDIVNFARLGRFINAPVKCYSQGMFVRLAFAIAIHVEPDILLIDDTLAVGDEDSQRRCIQKIFELKDEGRTIVFVSHDMNMIRRLCRRAILLTEGRVAMDGPAQRVIANYLETVGSKEGIGIIKKGDLKVVFNNGKILLYWKDIALTKHFGGYTSFLLKDSNQWVFSLDAQWQLGSLEKDRITARAKWRNLPLIQEWEVSLKGNNRIDWHVKTEIEQETLIKERQIGLLVTSDYHEWFCLHKKGRFPQYFFSKDNWEDMDMGDYQGGVIGLRGTYKDKGSLPGIVFEVKDEKKNFLKVQNTGYTIAARALQSYIIEETINDFSGTIRLLEEDNLIDSYLKEARDRFLAKKRQEQQRLLESRSIKKGNVRLCCDIDKKSLRLFWKGKEITSRPGLHSAFLLEGSWHDLQEATWEFKREAKNSLSVNFSWESLCLSQLWHLSLTEHNQILWDIQMKVNEALRLDITKAGLGLIKEYNRWFCSYQQQEFPENFSFWQDMPIEDKDSRLFGLRSKQEDTPGIIMDISSSPPGSSCLIQNSDPSISSRILQAQNKETVTFKPGNYPYFKGTIRLLEEDNLIDSYLKEARDRFLAKKRQEQQRLLESRSIKKGNVRLCCDIDKKSLRLFWKGKEITSRPGLHSAFLLSDKRYHSHFASWQINKKGQEEISLTLNFPGISLAQVWEIKFQEENSLDLKIEIQLKKELNLFYKDIRLDLRKEYKNWITPCERGNLDGDYINGIKPIRLRNNKVTKIGVNSKREENLPGVIFDFTASSSQCIASISKRLEDAGEKIILQSSEVIPKKKQRLACGKYQYFKGKILIDRQMAPRIESPKALNKIGTGKLAISFEEGIGRIFWKGKELTSGLGMYTSIRSSNIWYDSGQAVWDIQELKGVKLKASGLWPYMSISQTWEIEIVDESTISWNVEMDIYGRAVIEREQTNIMLCKEYKNWVAFGRAQGQGEFPQEFNQDNLGFWDRMWSGSAQGSSVGVIGESILPSVSLDCSAQSKDYRAIIENSDALFRTRILQCQKINNMVNLSPRKYRYFAGTIRIDRLKKDED